MPTLAMYLCGAASVAILVLLWVPSFSIPAELAPAVMKHGIAPLTWTVAASAIAAIGLVLGWLVPGQAAAQVAVSMLLVAICIVFWNSMPSEETSASIDLAAVIAASLLPPILFGWLIGYGYRARLAALEPPHES